MATRMHRFYRLIPGLLIFSLGLNACSSASATPKPTAFPTSPVESSTQTASPVTAPTNTPTTLPTFLPTTDPDPTKQNAGILIFSMGDGGHQHLFVMHPNYLPVTRITDGDWDDRDPAISPDGNYLIFTSNRAGYWDLYLWDLVNSNLSQLTNSPEFEAAPDWSPDNQWITHESYSDSQSNILVRSVFDASVAPIQLTTGAGNNLDPDWSPLGRQIAFSTDRSGHNEVWIAQLDAVDNRFTVIAGGDEAEYTSPTWSPDGAELAWQKQNGLVTIETAVVQDSPSSRASIGTGMNPFWSPDGKWLMAEYDTPNQIYLTGYNAANGTLAFPMISLPAKPSSIQWAGGNSFENMTRILAAMDPLDQPTLCQEVQTIPTSSTGRFSLVELTAVNVSNPYISDMADECFQALRTTLGNVLGWDILANLESAALPITASPDPGLPQNWLYTGRAIALNLAPLESNWMVVSREDFEGQTYWRLWAKCLAQDGSCGTRMDTPVWDFPSRASGDLVAFEDGGKLVTPPAGYWIDITDIAQQFGWVRLPALSNWRSYYPGIQFNLLSLTRGMSWDQAMHELYPDDAINLVRAGK